ARVGPPPHSAPEARHRTPRSPRRICSESLVTAAGPGGARSSGGPACLPGDAGFDLDARPLGGRKADVRGRPRRGQQHREAPRARGARRAAGGLRPQAAAPRRRHCAVRAGNTADSAAEREAAAAAAAAASDGLRAGVLRPLDTRRSLGIPRDPWRRTRIRPNTRRIRPRVTGRSGHALPLPRPRLPPHLPLAAAAAAAAAASPDPRTPPRPGTRRLPRALDRLRRPQGRAGPLAGGEARGDQVPGRADRARELAAAQREGAAAGDAGGQGPGHEAGQPHLRRQPCLQGPPVRVKRRVRAVDGREKLVPG
ncbi:hypothetical protein DFJ74DRAFT_140737, partial [Hyaloraphidium curvatum]